MTTDGHSHEQTSKYAIANQNMDGIFCYLSVVSLLLLLLLSFSPSLLLSSSITM